MPDSAAPVLLAGPLTEPQIRLVEVGLRRFGPYRASSQRKRQTGPGSVGRPTIRGRPAPMGWRHDVTVNLLRTSDRSGRRSETPRLMNARNNYFRGNWVVGDEVRLPGIGPLMDSEMLIESARTTVGRPLVVPRWLYVNVLLPGQELAVHTDVPEFIGARRDRVPGWLLVTMHHSGLFEDRRVPVATAVTYVDDESTGAFYYHPDPTGGPAVTLERHRNTALMFDADSVFHGVTRTPGSDPHALLAITATSTLRYGDEERWALEDRGTHLAGYEDRDLRFSLSWKAACFTDQRQQEQFRGRMHELSVELIMARLTSELRNRKGVDLPVKDMTPRDLATALVNEFIPFPPQPGSVDPGTR